MIRIALCDDNPADLAYYRKAIQENAGGDLPEPEIMTFSSAESLQFALEDVRDLTDLIFINVRMSGMDGIIFAEGLRRSGYMGDFVFLTESGEDALRAFDVGALNYIFKNEKNRNGEERTRRVIRQALESALKKRSVRLIIQRGGETRSICIREVQYFEVKDHLIVAHYGKESFSFLCTIGKIEKVLGPYGFVRCHRSALVSVHYVRSVTRKEAVMDCGETVPVSRKRLPILLSRMNEAGKGCHSEE